MLAARPRRGLRQRSRSSQEVFSCRGGLRVARPSAPQQRAGAGAMRLIGLQPSAMNRRGRGGTEAEDPWRDRTTHLAMSTLKFMRRLATPVPRPRRRLIRFHGVRAPTPSCAPTSSGRGGCRRRRHVEAGQAELLDPLAGRRASAGHMAANSANCCKPNARSAAAYSRSWPGPARGRPARGRPARKLNFKLRVCPGRRPVRRSSQSWPTAFWLDSELADSAISGPRRRSAMSLSSSIHILCA